MGKNAHEIPTTRPLDYQEVEKDPTFRELKKRHRSFVFPLAIAFLAWYIAYVFLAAYAHEFMARPVFGAINMGIVLGLGQFVTTFAITTWYVSYANRKLDPLAAKMRAKLEAEESAR
ncbi:hypothetical protein GCM10022198_17830 [Klugiella xanthotipulae]|nr:DUF485 domain-containing protein [Klugiella xanthotipulae]